MVALFFLDRFDRPAYLWLLLILVLVWWFSRRSLSGLGPIRGWVCLTARALLIILLVFALAGINKVQKTDDLSVLFLVDVSKSIPADIRRAGEQFVINACKGMKKDDRAAILTFDGQTNIEQLPSRPGAEGGVHIPTPFPDGQKPDQSNLAQALRMAVACALNSTNNRVVLVSDGNQNVGDAVQEAKNTASNGISIDVFPLNYSRGAEVVFEQIRVPPYANLHEQIPIRLTLSSDRTASGTIRLYERVGTEQKLVDLNPNSDETGQRVTLNPGKNTFSLPYSIEASRAHEFSAEFIPDDATVDEIAENNVARAFTNVEGPQRVLLVGQRDHQDADEYLVAALAKENIPVQWVAADAVNIDPRALADYSAVILSNVGADNFSGDQHRTLASYVRDLGGGLLMIGGDDSFGAGGWQGSLVEDVMPVKFDVDAIRQIPRGALAIVMHSCEMPQGNKWGIDTAVAALKTLSRLDYFGVVGWGIAGFRWEVPMQIAANKDGITEQIYKMQNSDMFDFETPMKMAFDALMSCKDAAQRHMIIISDGDPQAPTSGLLNRMVGNKVTCSAVSIFPHGGMEIQTMQSIAKATGGQYYSLNKAGDEQRLPKIFIKEAKIVRRPLIRDEVFTPQVRPNLSDIMTGITGFPELFGYVVTTPRQSAEMEMPLVTKRGDPLLAHWRYGTGHTLAFTSGEWNRWASEWPEWASFSKLWAQAVRWCMRQGTAADFEVSSFSEGDIGHVVVETADLQTFRQFTGTVVKPDGSSISVPIVQVGPGRYEAQYKADQQGTYMVSLTAPGVAEEKPVRIMTGMTLAFSPEYKDLTVNDARLNEIAMEGKGRVLAPEDADSKIVFAHNLPPTVTRTPIWETILKLALLMLLIDVAVRRIAIDPLKIAASTRRYIASLAGRWGSGKQAERTLKDLRTIREQVRAEKTTVGDAAALQRPTPRAAPPTDAMAGKKFDADGAPGKPTGDLMDAMGGAKAAPDKPKPTEKKETTGPQESTTARLLKAKKRAQDQTDQENKQE